MIRLDNISKQNGHQILFIEASMGVQKGEKVGLVGPNGAGKTTLFRMITGQEQPDDGLVAIEPGMTIERRVRGPRRWPGIDAGLLALLMLASTTAGIQLASRNQLVLANDAADAAIAFSAAAIVFGLIAIVKSWGRGAGIAGAVVAVLGNPLVLLYGLSALGGS